MDQGTKRKRAASLNATTVTKTPRPTSLTPGTPVQLNLLQQCYPQVCTLRQYFLSRLPSSSRLRRKKFAVLGQSNEPRDIEVSLAHLLDTTLVCSAKQEEQQLETSHTRWQQWLSFSQKGDESYVSLAGGAEASKFSQSEIVDFVIWLLFSKEKASKPFPKHLLCDGFRKAAGDGDHQPTTIAGVFSRFPNAHVHTLKKAPWPQLLALLGQSGERLMIDLLLDSSIFVAVTAGFGNYYQLSGTPLYDLDMNRNAPCIQPVNSTDRKPSDITLVRSRLFYAKPALTARGLVQAGFKHIHALNRCPHTSTSEDSSNPPDSTGFAKAQRRNEANAIKVLMYMFPRQFGLHNVFTSEVDRKQTAQKFQDYTLRDAEISSELQDQPNNSRPPKVPKRLRGTAKHLVQRLQILHQRCSYTELLKHYCPCPFDSTSRAQGSASCRDAASTPANTQNRPSKTHPSQSQWRARSKKVHRRNPPQSHPTDMPQCSVIELACAAPRVSAFCQAVLSKIIPDAFWGEGDVLKHNKRMILRKVDHFVKLRRFETMSLHEMVQDLKIVEIPWLQPPHLQGQKTSQTDINKRYELFHEFLYYVFDSLLIPLIRSNFYVTESNTHRYHLFYFRHEVWKRVAEPAMATLKETMFEEVNTNNANRILVSRSLGFGQMRLLPKRQGLRPIMNLRRRAATKGSSRTLGPSINTVLGPVHTFLKLETKLNPTKLGSTMFSVNDMYMKLKEFKAELGNDHPPLYFAKLDVHAAFDTIPQEAVVRLMGSIPGQDQYTITKHAEVKPGERTVAQASRTATQPIRKWHATALGRDGPTSFPDRLEDMLGGRKRNTVFIDSAARKSHGAVQLLDLLAEHVTQNLVKIGKKYYRQKTGIPQGSVLSSFLCNYFYADLEMRHLSFLDGSDCLLLRLIDDFLLITLDKGKAVEFVKTMHQGLPDYGVEVSSKKTLVNFDVEVEGQIISKIGKGERFPYCGTLIDCKTLEIGKDWERGKETDISHSLTVDYGRSPGQNFERKVLGAFKIQSHLMFFDTMHNSTHTVLNTLQGAFAETARKMWAYIRCMPKAKQPRSSLIIRTIIKVIDVAFILLTGKSRRMRYEHYSCEVRKGQVAMAACQAFLDVLGKKQAGYGEVLNWLRKETTRLQSQSG